MKNHKLSIVPATSDIINRNVPHSGGNNGNNGGDGMNLENRVDKLDQDVRDMRLDLAEIKGQLPHLATKAEVVSSRNTIIYWLIGLFVATGLFNHFFDHELSTPTPVSVSQGKS